MSFIYYDPLFNRSTGSREIELTNVLADTATIINGYITNLTTTNGIISSLKVDSIEKNTALSNLEIKNSGGDILLNATNTQTKNIIPYANTTYNIGTALLKYNNLYLDTANITTGNITTLNCGTIQNISGNMTINCSGTMTIENDNDNSTINIGYYDGATTTQGKTINIGDAGDTTVNIDGTAINVLNRLRIGNDATSITNDLQVQTTNSTSSIYIYCNKVGGGGVSFLRNGAWGGGEIWIISNAVGSSYYGIPTGTSGISSIYGDLVLAANATTQSEYLRLGKISSTNYIQCSAHTIPKTNEGFDLGSSSYYWNTLYTKYISTTNQITSTLADGTKPFVITSTTKCDNLNADLLDGYHSSSFEPTLTKGNLSETTSSILTISNGSSCVIGSGTTISVQQADATHNGYLTSSNWSTFNGKFDLPSGITFTSSGISSSNDFTLTTTSSKNLTLTASGNLYISNDDYQGFVYIGSATSGNKTVYLGSQYDKSVIYIQAGTGGIIFNGSVKSDFSPISNDNYSLGGSSYHWKEAYISTLYCTTQNITTVNLTTMTGAGAISIYTSSGYDLTLNTGRDMFIGNDTTTSSIYVGTGAGAKTLTVGSTNGASITTIQAGTGGILLSGTIKSNLTPQNATWYLGGSSNYWARSYVTDAYGATLSLTGQLTSTQADGTKPFVITSTTKCDNLNADLLDGYHSSSFEPTLTKGNLSETTSSVLTITGGTNAVIGSGCTIQVKASSSSQNGYLSSTDWSTFNGKQNALTIGNLSETTSSVLTITGGTSSIIGSGLTIAVKQAGSGQNGYLSSTDWSTFNGKQNALTIGNLSETTSSVLTITGGTSSIIGSGLTIAVKQAGSGQNGYLSSTDWSTFNGKQNALTIGNLSETTSSVLTITGGTSSIIGSGLTIAVKQCNNSTDGYLSHTDWNTFNGKENSLVKGNLSETTSSILTISNGTSCVLGTGTTIAVQQADSTHNGYLSSSNWTTFNGKFDLPSGITFTGSELSSTGDFKINSTGGHALSIENDNDNSTINIGYYDGSTTTQGKTINIGDVGDTTVNIDGTAINVLNRLRIGNDATSITNDLQVQTTNSTASIYIYCDKVGGGGVSFLRNGAWGGGEILTISNASGSTYYGISTGTSGISSIYGDLVLAANATTQAEYLRLGKISSTNYIQCSAHTIPSSTNTYDLGSSSYYWNNGYLTTINNTIINTTTINKTGGDLTLQNTTSGNIILSPYSYVGIGTATPASLVHIKSDSIDALSNVGLSANYLLCLHRNDTTNDKGIGLCFSATSSIGTNIGASIICKRIGSNACSELQFYTKTSTTVDIAPTQKMVIKYDGKVGINTTAPDKMLEINDASGNCLRLTYNDNNGSASNYCDMAVSSGGNLTITPSGGEVNITTLNTTSANMVIKTTTSGDIVFYPQSTYIRGYSDDTYYLGSSSYKWKNVYSSAIETATINNTSANIVIKTTTSGDIVFQPVSTYVRPYSYNDYYLGHASYIWKGLYVNNIYDNNFYTNYIQRDNTGDLTIETTDGSLNLNAVGGYVRLKGAPTYSYSIAPAANETYDIGAVGNRYNDLHVKYITCHQIGAVNYVDISDRRQKENIEPLDKGIEFIKKLEPQKFKFKGMEGKHYGFIAQDTETIDDDNVLVQKPTNEEDNYTMNYKALIPVLVKAMKEQQKKIDELERKINILTA